MNNEPLTLEELEATTAAQEATWLSLQHIAQTNTPAWKQAAESISTQDSSIHGKGTRHE